MSQKKILTICIPTYNRAELLAECVNSIISQLDENLQQVIDIHIFDNASTDGTEAYCNDLVAKFPYIKYTRNIENIGPDRNFYNILQYNTESKFKHMLSDDDKYAAESLKDFVGFLFGHDDLHFVYLNYANFKTSDQNNIYDALCHSVKIKSYIKKSDFIRIVKNEYSFLSGMVFNSDIIDMRDIDRFTKTNWLQSYALFQSTANSERKIAFYGPLTVLKRSDDCEVSYNIFKVFGANYFALSKFAYEQCGYNKRIMQKMIAIRWKKLLFNAKLNGVDKSEYADILEIAKREKGLKRILIYAKIPHWICVVYHKLKYMVKGH